MSSDSHCMHHHHHLLDFCDEDRGFPGGRFSFSLQFHFVRGRMSIEIRENEAMHHNVTPVLSHSQEMSERVITISCQMSTMDRALPAEVALLQLLKRSMEVSIFFSMLITDL